MLTIFEFFSHILSKEQVKEQTMFSREITLNKSLVLISLIALITSLTKIFSSLLFLIIICFFIWICSLMIRMVIVSRAWSDTKCQSGWIEWLSSSSDLNLKNIRFRTKFKSWLLSRYLVGTYLVGTESSRKKESAMSKNKSLWIE